MVVAVALLSLFFAVIYYFAPDVKRSNWHWITPGATIGIIGWLLASFGLRAYVHIFNNYSVTYGSLGAVIILLTWFYLTGLNFAYVVLSHWPDAAARSRDQQRNRGRRCSEASARYRAE